MIAVCYTRLSPNLIVMYDVGIGAHSYRLTEGGYGVVVYDVLIGLCILISSYIFVM